MTDTWGIPGPAFLALYLGLALIPLAVNQLRLFRLRTGPRTTAPLTNGYQVAALAGGTERVADTVLAAMLEREQVRIDSVGRLYITPARPADALGLAAATAIGSRAPTQPSSLREVLAADPAMAALLGELSGAGLFVDEAKRHRAWLETAAAYVPLLVFGLVRLAAGGTRGKPMVVLAILIVAVTGLAVAAVLASTPKPARVTSAGDRALDATRADRSLLHGAAADVALYGLSAYPDREIRKVLVSARGSGDHGPGWAVRVGRSSRGIGSSYGGASSCGVCSCGGGGSSCGGGGGGCGG
ncbi:TIGR04222 domain-containing membrane protein [Amycolatopsis sp. NPDC058986]|uniref:TIGR04222 domain-containing membrane protein n=1 Tax=unclassified Amycolatopsis TaxID=2618356 RepID=UPI00366DE1DE